MMTCIVVGALTGTVLPGQEENERLVRSLFISDPELIGAGYLPEVLSGEIWRVFTPIFLHFGVIHILCNMSWLWHLGCMVEARRGSGLLAAFVAISAAISNLAQYQFGGGPSFGGMSGVVAALIGYVWMQGKYNRAAGLYLDPRSLSMALIFMALCFIAPFLRVANAAHLGGLIVGVVWGRLAAFRASRQPE